MGVGRISCPRYRAYTCVSWGREMGEEWGGYCPPLWEEVEAPIRTPAKRLCINCAKRGKTLLPRAQVRSR